MKKVYVLMGGCIDDQHIIGVYSSEKKAEEEREKALLKRTDIISNTLMIYMLKNLNLM